MIKHT